jgi:hypothetical protein
MKKHLEKSLKLLDKYLAETSKETVDEELESCKWPEYDGPTLDQYLERLNSL